MKTERPDKMTKWVQACVAACLIGIVAYLVGLLITEFFPRSIVNLLTGIGIYGCIVINSRLVEFLRS